MAIALDQLLGVRNRQPTGTSASLSISAAVPVGRLVVVYFTNNGGGAVTGIVDTRGNTWEFLGGVETPGSGRWSFGFFGSYITTALHAADTITMSFANFAFVGPQAGFGAASFRGFGATFAGYGEHAVQGGLPAVASSSPIQAGDLVLGVMGLYSSSGNGTPTMVYADPAGWSALQHGDEVGASFDIPTSSGTVTYNASGTTLGGTGIGVAPNALGCICAVSGGTGAPGMAMMV